MKILILHGPNLNLLGVRNAETYGSFTQEDILNHVQWQFPQCSFELFQSNHEGELIEMIQKKNYDALIINVGAYTHTSVGIYDALEAIKPVAVEVHISHVEKREDFRQRSFVAPHCLGTISGFGIQGYEMAVSFLTRNYPPTSAS
jgi:3-dehydroquinate dehydratase-2